MIITFEEAQDKLRIDGTDNYDFVVRLIKAIPEYLKATTGSDWLEGDNELAKTTAMFILEYWYYGPNGDYSSRLKNTIDSLLITLTTMANKTK